MNVYINNQHFTEEPCSCGSCPFFNNGRTAIYGGDEKGICLLFDETHHRWKSTPSRCRKLFRKAARYEDGEQLVITANMKKHEDNSND